MGSPGEAGAAGWTAATGRAGEGGWVGFGAAVGTPLIPGLAATPAAGSDEGTGDGAGEGVKASGTAVPSGPRMSPIRGRTDPWEAMDGSKAPPGSGAGAGSRTWAGAGGKGPMGYPADGGVNWGPGKRLAVGSGVSCFSLFSNWRREVRKWTISK